MGEGRRHKCRTYKAKPATDKESLLNDGYWAAGNFLLVYLPSVMPVFSKRVRGLFALLMIVTSGLTSAGMKTCISSPSLTAISPAAQAALLHTETYPGSRLVEIKGISCATLGRTRAGQVLERSPNKAKAD